MSQSHLLPLVINTTTVAKSKFIYSLWCWDQEKCQWKSFKQCSNNIMSIMTVLLQQSWSVNISTESTQLLKGSCPVINALLFLNKLRETKCIPTYKSNSSSSFKCSSISRCSSFTFSSLHWNLFPDNGHIWRQSGSFIAQLQHQEGLCGCSPGVTTHLKFGQINLHNRLFICL